MHCDQHDYIEIACMFGYRISLELRDGRTLQGIPLTTSTEKDKTENLLFRRSDGEEMKLPFTSLRRMTALNPQARFKTIEFS